MEFALFVPVLLALSAGLVVYALNLLFQKSPVEARFADYDAEAHPQVKQSYFETRLRPIAKRLARMFPSLQRWVTPRDVEDRLLYAGEPFNLTANEFYGLQLLSMIVSAVYGMLMGTIVARYTGLFIGAIGIGAIGLFLPVMWLNGRVKKRQLEITIAVPDSIDLLATSMEAGLGFDIALHHVVSRTTGPLQEELKRFIRELRMGIPREECFRRLITRNSSEELRTVVGAMLQAQLLGAPLSKTLQDQAEQMRERRLQRAKEAGAKASPKISLVTTILIAPSVMCLFISVIVFKLTETMGPLLEQFSP
jgi:tight adherence protein C